MILDLEHYQADSQYPIVRSVHPDKQLADKLMEGYCGESSELTTILQYAYHSLQYKRKYEEISKITKGISYVETIHMELLGDCISKLGGDLRYTLALQEKSIYWQSSFVNYESTLRQMLQTDIQGEKKAVNFYETTSTTVNQPEIAKLLLRLSEDEKLHVRIFTDLFQRYFC